MDSTLFTLPRGGATGGSWRCCAMPAPRRTVWTPPSSSSASSSRHGLDRACDVVEDAGMPRRDVPADWSIELDDSFQGRVVDGSLQFVSAGPPMRTVWLAVWSPPVTEPAES